MAIIGLGLIGSSIARAVAERLPDINVSGYDADRATRATARELSLASRIAETAGEAVTGADLIILCVPVGAMGAVAQEIRDHVAPGAIISLAPKHI